MENVPNGRQFQETPLLQHVTTVARYTWNCRVVSVVNVPGVKGRVGSAAFLVQVHCDMIVWWVMLYHVSTSDVTHSVAAVKCRGRRSSLSKAGWFRLVNMLLLQGNLGMGMFMT